MMLETFKEIDKGGSEAVFVVFVLELAIVIICTCKPLLCATTYIYVRVKDSTDPCDCIKDSDDSQLKKKTQIDFTSTLILYL